MFNRYFKIALRNFKRQPSYTLLNILGLTLGITASLFILLYITEESRFDTYHEKADRIYRVSSDLTEPDDAFKWAATQAPLAAQLKKDYPEVEEYARFDDVGRTQFERNGQFFYVEKVYMADSTVFDIFSFDFIKGDAKTALMAPNSIVLDATSAKKIFGNNNPIGETVKITGDQSYKVTGVYQNMPNHSHLIAEALVSPNAYMRTTNNWGGFNLYTYVLLKEEASAADFAAKLPEVIEQYVNPIFEQFKVKIKYELIPLTDIHLKSDFQGEPEPTGEISFLYIFGAIGLFLLLLAAINYMNLSTARATKRATEVGIKKVLGSERWQLIAQFLSESIIFTLIAFVLGICLVLLFLPLFNGTFGLNLSASLLATPTVLGVMLSILLLLGIAGGSYPAFFLSSFRPISVLKGKIAKGGGNPNLRKALVTIQFAITLFMLIGTGIIYDQMNFLSNKDLGFDKEHVLRFSLSGDVGRDKYPVIRERLLQNPKITDVGSAENTPGAGYGKFLMNVEEAEGGMNQLGVNLYGVDYDYFNTLGVAMVEGRGFSEEYSSDTSTAVLVNEAMVKRMAWTNPIGKKVQFGTDDTLDVYRVVGVVKDFHQRSLYDPIESLLFAPNLNNSQVHVRINPKDKTEVGTLIAYVENEWKKLFPNTPFEFDFVDAAFMELYEADQKRAHIFTLFSFLMIIIACLGLFGLASFTAEQRTKEIGVRRILGAETGNILYLLTRDFILLVGIAAVPAFLVVWYFMQQWLETFAYHTAMNYWLYAFAFLTVMLLTILTTGYHALRVALGNPIESLRYE
ncbi:MAG: ABC transporter permease [Bacteroidota bacterium]